VLGRALIELKRGDSGETHDSGVGPDVWLEVVKGERLCSDHFPQVLQGDGRGEAIMRQALPDCEIKESR